MTNIFYNFLPLPLTLTMSPGTAGKRYEGSENDGKGNRALKMTERGTRKPRGVSKMLTFMQICSN